MLGSRVLTPRRGMAGRSHGWAKHITPPHSLGASLSLNRTRLPLCGGDVLCLAFFRADGLAARGCAVRLSARPTAGAQFGCQPGCPGACGPCRLGRPRTRNLVASLADRWLCNLVDGHIPGVCGPPVCPAPLRALLPTRTARAPRSRRRGELPCRGSPPRLRSGRRHGCPSRRRTYGARRCQR